MSERKKVLKVNKIVDTADKNSSNGKPESSPKTRPQRFLTDWIPPSKTVESFDKKRSTRNLLGTSKARPQNLLTNWIPSSKSQSATKTAVEEKLMKAAKSSDKIEDLYFVGQKWWIQREIPVNERCDQSACTWEPTVHPDHYKACHKHCLVEKKILIKYLINRNAISRAKSLTIYEEMINEGYLSHRTPASLQNCFQKTIYKELHSYNLTESLLKEFLELKLETQDQSKTLLQMDFTKLKK